MIPLKHEFELEKNWYRKCKILETYHLFMSIQFPEWQLRDTARELNVSLGFTSESITLAKYEDTSIKELSRNAALKKVRGNSNEVSDKNSR